MADPKSDAAKETETEVVSEEHEPTASAAVVAEPTKDKDDGITTLQEVTDEPITPDSDLSDPSRRIWIVTTAALPWRTGTAVNALVRALYLCKRRPSQYVTLMVPWLEDPTSRKMLFGKEYADQIHSKADQEEWIREYCRVRANAPGKLRAY